MLVELRQSRIDGNVIMNKVLMNPENLKDRMIKLILKNSSFRVSGTATPFIQPLLHVVDMFKTS